MPSTADFETTTQLDDCRVWAYSIVNIDNPTEFYVGNSIDDFIEHLALHPDTYYFHNLKFDGEFILDWLMKHGFTWIKNRKELEPLKFNTLISDMGVFYSIEFILGNGSKVRLLDSFKIIPLKVRDIPKAFGLEDSKLEIDYTETREPGHVLTEQERAYVLADSMIVAKALKIQFEQGLTKMTQGSNAFHDFKTIITNKKFKKWFPKQPFEIDQDIRQSYKGGWVYVNPKYKGVDIGEGIVLDVNSLYPWVMHECLLPFGEPVAFKGEYVPDKAYPLYVTTIRCNFDLKPEHVPMIQLRKNPYGFGITDYISSSDGHDITMCLTSVDLKLFMDHYDVYNVEYMGGWKFMASNMMLRDYIDKWFQVKAEATVTGNAGLRTLAKLMLNSLYGKFALNPRVQSKIPYYDGRVKYRLGPEERRDPIYIPMGTFITAYAREKTIRSAQLVYDRFAYADTDSLHLVGTALPDTLEIDDVNLGAWKREAKFDRARFLHQKTYVEEINGRIEVTCAGMPESCYANVSWGNFKHGSIFDGKLRPVHVDGGIVLVPTTHTLRG